MATEYINCGTRKNRKMKRRISSDDDDDDNETVKSPQEKFDKNTAHFIGQWMMGPILITLSDNWKPFPSSINYLLKEYDVNEFGKDRIQLLHYCGVGAGELVKKHFKEYFDSV